MAEPFKNLINEAVIADLASCLDRASQGAFDVPRFTELASRGLHALELKARTAQITDALGACLPPRFEDTAAVITAALHPDVDPPLRGWGVMALADHVARQGIEHPDVALPLLARLSPRFSSEFAVRPFLAADAERALPWFHRWTRDPDEHVRRLASEGSRPRLPWGVRLQRFVADPSPLLPILEALKDDPSEYVRRSVANHLNDIAKDHPDLVASIAARWLEDAGPERARLVRHACRTLVKQGHPVLATLGAGAVRVTAEAFAVLPARVVLGEAITLSLTLRSLEDGPRKVVVDYVVHHRKANGGTSPKVFKWAVRELPAGGVLRLERRHAVRPITTRRYHPGEHVVEVQVNGAIVARAAFELVGEG